MATQPPPARPSSAIGAVLASHPRLAILAPPGGGKSTLLKRLAVAYADPERRRHIDDGLPDRPWLPLFFRCRELRELTRGSFGDLLHALSERATVRHHAAAFRALVDRALLAGQVLLLVDGLDEIPDPSDRATFVCMLRTTLQAYPKIGVVITSREAGFRNVAAHLASACTSATLTPFDADDISRLTVAWHREVVGDNEQVRAEAIKLAQTIASNDRICRLARNPLLLTTLLLVRRYVGELPTRRVVLYGEAVEVLLRTWNVEGHAPIDLEEALPQLCYIAHAMMQDGMQKISRSRLAALLARAREQLTTELGFATVSVGEFIDRVEYRSSLLMMTGQDVEAGLLTEFYEFRHLTFQEYLAARAVVEGWHCGRDASGTLVSVLWPYVEDDGWRETILLAVALGRKQSDGFIRKLCSGLNEKPRLASLLAQCLADEAPAQPDTIREALDMIIMSGQDHGEIASYPALARGRYGRLFREQARLAYQAGRPHFDWAANALALVIHWQADPEGGQAERLPLPEQCAESLRLSDPGRRCEGALILVQLAKTLHYETPSTFAEGEGGARYLGETTTGQWGEVLGQTAEAIVEMLFTDHPAQQHAACLVIESFGECQIRMPSMSEASWFRLMELGTKLQVPSVNCRAKAALFAQLRIPRCHDDAPLAVDHEQLDSLVTSYDQLPDSDRKLFVLMLAWHRGAPWNDLELAARAVLLADAELSAAARVGKICLLSLLTGRLLQREDVPRELKESMVTMIEVLLKSC